MQHFEHRDEKLSRNGERKITTRQLDDQRVPELDGLAEISECICVLPLSLRLPCQPEEQVRLADEVERHVGERDVLLEDRSMTAPLGQAMTQDQAIVT